MITNTECALQGQFKVDIYNKENHLVDTTDWFNNYITNTGLFYPLTYPFADCFRFLSLGSSSSANTDATTGLVNPMSFNNKFSVLDENGSPAGFQHVSHWGKEAYHVAGPPPDYATPGSCGAQHHKTGPLLFRGWNVPSGNFYVSKNLNINEFAVSPSSGADPLGSKAFSRIVKPIIIPSGTRSIISYRLKLAIDSGIKTFGAGTFSIAGADTSEGSTILNTLGNLSGYYRQVYHGFRLVDNQGRTYIPKYGEAMEPSCKNLDKLSLYLSPAYSQFSANPLGGAGNGGAIYHATSDSGLYPLSYGHAITNIRSVGSEDEFYSLNQLEQSTIPEEKINVFGIPAHTYLLKNIRLKSDDNAHSKMPNLADYTSGVSFDFTESLFTNPSMALATQGDQGYNDSYLNQGFKCSFSADISNLKFNKAEQTGRTKTFTRKATFSPVNNFDWNSRYGAMVYAYRNGSDFYPVMDTLFYDSAGRSFRLDTYTNIGFELIKGNQVLDFIYEIVADNSVIISRQWVNLVEPLFLGMIVNLGPETDKSGLFLRARPVPSIPSVSIVGGATFQSPGGFKVSDPGSSFNAKNQLIDYITPQPIILDGIAFHSGKNEPGYNFVFGKSNVDVSSFPGSFPDEQYRFYHETGAFSRGEVANYNGQNWACIKNVPALIEDTFAFFDATGLNPGDKTAPVTFIEGLTHPLDVLFQDTTNVFPPTKLVFDEGYYDPGINLKRGSTYDFSYAQLLIVDDNALESGFHPTGLKSNFLLSKASGLQENDPSGFTQGFLRICFFNSGTAIGRYLTSPPTPVNIGEMFAGIDYSIDSLRGVVRHDALPSVSQLKYGFELIDAEDQKSFLGERYVLGTVNLLDYPGLLGPTGNTGYWMFLNNQSATPALGRLGAEFNIVSTTGLYIVYKNGQALLPFSGDPSNPYGGDNHKIRLSGCANGSGVFSVNFTTQEISPVDILTALPYEYGQSEFNNFIPKTALRVTNIDMNSLAERGYGKGWATNQFTTYTYSGNYHAATGQTGIPIGVSFVETVARTYRNAIPFGGKLTFNRSDSPDLMGTYVFGAGPNGNVSWTNFQQPSGRLVITGSPSFRTLPNHGLYPQEGTDEYPLGVAGAGHYPGLSSLNSLDVYLSTTWTA